MFNRLSEIDRDVLALAEMNLQSVLQMSHALRLRPHLVQYSFAKLRRLGFLSDRRAWIDVHQLGYNYATLYLRPMAQGSKARQALIRALKKNRICTWLFETSGEYHLACSLTFKSVSEIYKFYDSVESSEIVAIPKKALNLQRDFEFFGRKYLRSPRCKVPSVFLPASREEREIDADDIKILGALSHGNLGTEAEMALKAGIPIATFNRRLSRLRSQGLVRGFSYWLESSMLGRQLFILRVTVSGLARPVKSQLWNFGRSHPLVVYILESIGSWDFELGVDLSSSSELSTLMEEVSATVPGIELDVDPIAVTKFHKLRAYPAA